MAVAAAAGPPRVAAPRRAAADRGADADAAGAAGVAPVAAPAEVHVPLPAGAWPPAVGCRRGNPLANVYRPLRLWLLAPCSTVTGTVAGVEREPDGDIHVDVLVDPAYRGMLTPGNVRSLGGELVTEIVSADQPGCVPGGRPPGGGYGTCTGADVPSPRLGARVRETGAFVVDLAHGWSEIHPVWRLVALPGG